MAKTSIFNMSNLLSQIEISSSSHVGAKTKNLKILQELGLAVPQFVAVSAEVIAQVEKNSNLDELAKEIGEKLTAQSYAVRSSALIEDSDKESFAGQFTTKLNVSSSELSSAIVEVIAQAREFLHDDLSKFSLLIQEFIEPDYAGIIFTRNPLGGREMIIEYHSGRGEEVVSGKVKPERIELFWNLKTSPHTILPGLEQAIEVAKNIEHHFNLPQDIEWCIKDGKWYWLQTRPITTISQEHYQQSLYLDEYLPRDTKFLYQKTELSEIAARPTPFTFSLLQKIYDANGPVAQVYKKYKVKFQSRDFLKIIGNELFVDREEEIKTLLPSYSFLSSSNSQPKLSQLSDIGMTLKNLFALSKFNVSRYVDIFNNLKIALERDEKEDYFEKYIKNLLEEYQIIFETNLLAGKAVQKLQTFLKHEKVGVAGVLSWGVKLIKLEDYQIDVQTLQWQGNSLEINDEIDFVRQEFIQKDNTNELDEWWNTLSDVKKKMLEKSIQEAVIYSRLREYGRWLIIKKITTLRKLAFEQAQKMQFKEIKNAYFATIDELIRGTISENECAERKKVYDSFSSFSFPSTLSSEIQPFHLNQPQGVSPGIAEGVLVTKDMIDDPQYKDVSKILYTPVLSPDLTQYFDQIVGIVSESGGMLSHLAIVAREKKMPVVVNVRLEVSKIKLGERISIDGECGKWNKK